MPTRKAPPGYAPPLPAGCIQRAYREGEEYGILQLLIAAFDGEWPRRNISVPAIEHLGWKLRSDALATQLHLVAELEGRIIGARPVWVDRVKVGGRVLLTRLAIDRAIAPEFQRMRVMTAMEARTPPEWFSQFDVLVGVVNNWQSISFVPGIPYRRRLDVMARVLKGELPQTDGQDWAVGCAESFDGRADELWDRASRDFELAMVRTQERLNYRFADERAGDYRIAIAEQDERLLGYIVYSWRRALGQLVDLLVLPKRLDVLESLIAFALRDMQTAGNARVECWRDLHHPYGPAFERLGFNETRGSQRISLHSLREDEVETAFFADPRIPVHFMAGDTDLV